MSTPAKQYDEALVNFYEEQLVAHADTAYRFAFALTLSLDGAAKCTKKTFEKLASNLEKAHGGGDANKGLATTPLPFTADVSHGDAAVNQQRSLSALEQKQQQLLTQVRQQIVQLAQTVRQENDPEKQQALEQKRRQLLDMLGAIERQIQQQNAKPRRRFIGPSTREAAYALYYDKLRTRIETLGTREFPQSGGNKLYGSLIMSITIGANGRLVAADVVQSSGNPTLDRQARAIVEAAQPYGRFTDAMLRQADQIVVISRFRFTRTQGLETAVQAPQSPAQATP